MTRHPKTARRVAEVTRRRQDMVRLFDGAPFTRQQAFEVGLSETDLRSPLVRTLERGVYVAADIALTHSIRCAGAALRLPAGGRIAGHSAARLRNLPVPHHDQLVLSIPRGTRFAAASHRVLRHDRPAEERMWLPECRQRVPVTAPASILEECAPDLPLVDSVVLADALLGRSRGADEIGAKWLTSRSARVRRIAGLAREGAESPLETRTRLLLVLAGLPCPETQVEVHLGGRPRRFDLAWREYGVAVEYDGSYHYASEDQKQADIVREEDARRAGWLVLRVVSVGIYRDPAPTVERVTAALRSRGCPVAPREEWRLHFPQRESDEAGIAL